MKLKKDELYTVKALGQTNKYWDGQGFKAEVPAKALPISGDKAESLLLGRKPGEMQVDVYTKPALVLPSAKEATKGLEEAHAKKLQELGRNVIDAVVKAGTETYQLCKYIRENSVAPKLVSHELRQLGFSKGWASQVNKVSQCSDEAWSAFEARTFTFKQILALKEGGTASLSALAEEMGTNVVDIKAQVAEMEEEEDKKPELIPATPKEQREARKKQNERAFATLVKNFAQEKNFKTVNIVVDGFKFVITKAKIVKVDEAKKMSEKPEARLV